MMDKIFILSVLVTSLTFAQFKGDDSKPVDIRSGILSDNPVSSFLNFFDASKFDMNHSFSMSYSASGNNGLALGVYTNSISYEFNEDFNFELNTSFVNSPYNSLGKDFTNSLNGVYIDRARINYSPSEDFKVVLQYSNSPVGYYNGYYGRYNNRGYSRLSNFWYD